MTYLDSANGNPDNLLYGQNGLAAFTLCDVPIELKRNDFLTPHNQTVLNTVLLE